MVHKWHQYQNGTLFHYLTLRSIKEHCLCFEKDNKHSLQDPFSIQHKMPNKNVTYTQVAAKVD